MLHQNNIIRTLYRLVMGSDLLILQKKLKTGNEKAGRTVDYCNPPGFFMQMHSPYSLSLLSVRQMPFCHLRFRSTSKLPEADSVPAIRRRIREFRLHPCCFDYSLFLRSHSTSFIASVEHLGAFGDDHKKRYSPVFSQHLWGGKHLVFDLYSCDIAPFSFG